MKRIAGIIAGVLAGYVLYTALAFGILAPIQRASGRSPEAYLGIAFLVLMPIALFLGGVLCGYIAGDIPGRRWPFAMLHAPGLYMFLGGLPFLRGTVAGFQASMIAAGCVWIAASTPGVLLGAVLRSRSAPTT